MAKKPDSYYKKQVTKYKVQVKTAAAKATKIGKQITATQKAADGYTDQIAKYEAPAKALDQSIQKLDKQIANAQAKVSKSVRAKVKKIEKYISNENKRLSKAKSTSAKNTIKKQIAKYQKQILAVSKSGKTTATIKKLQVTRTAYTNKLDSIDPKIKKLRVNRTKKTKQVSKLKKTQKAANNKKNKAKANQDKAQKVLNDRANANKQTAIKKATKAISAKIKKEKAKKYDATTYTNANMAFNDTTSSTVVFMFEYNVSEQTDSDVTQSPVDNSDPRTDHSRVNSKSNQMTMWLTGKTRKDIDKSYKQLLAWQSEGAEVHYQGSIYWKHAWISSLNKTYDQPYSNVLQVTFTLIYAQKAKITTTAKKKKKARPKKAKKKATGGKKKAKSTKKYVKVKKGNTYWGFMMKYGTKVSTLEKWNPWAARRIPIGVKCRVK